MTIVTNIDGTYHATGAADHCKHGVYYEPWELVYLLADDIAEVADSAPSVYTAARWAQFADLAAWNEDIADYGPLDDLTASAGVALYMIAERLAAALVERWGEELAAEVDA